MAQGEQGTYSTWGGHHVPELFADHQAKHGALPNFAIFGGSEEALVKMRGGFDVDVSHPCNQGLVRWIEPGLFQPIDTSRLSNWPDLIDIQGNLGEGGRPWLAPFEWGQTSITFRTGIFDLEGQESWNMLWDPRYAGRLGSLSAGADAWWCGAIKAGVDFKDIATPEAFEKIGAVMREQRPLIPMYTDDTTTLEQALSSGELAAAMTWNSTATQLKSEGVPVNFAKPKEGALTWVCGVMIHKDAPNLDKAYDIIDSLLSVSAGEFVIRDYGYVHSKKKAFDAFDAATPEERGSSQDPTGLLNAGHFQVSQTQDWESQMNETFELIEAGY